MSDEFRQRIIDAVGCRTTKTSSAKWAMDAVLDVLASEAWVRDEWIAAVDARDPVATAPEEAVQATLSRSGRVRPRGSARTR